MAAIVVVAVVTRAFRLGADSFWLDEAASWWFASRPLAEQWGQVPFYEPHPPLYYTLLSGWSWLFDESEAALRGLSAFASVLTVPVVYGMGRLALRGNAGIWTGTVAALLAALHPVQIQYAQETRAYALLMLAVAVLLLALLASLRSPAALNRPLSAILRDRASGMRCVVVSVVIATAAAFWFHNTALILVGALLPIAAWLLLKETGYSWQLVRNFVAIGLIVLLLWSPNIRWLASGMSEVTAGFWLQPPMWWDTLYVGDLLLGSADIAVTEAWKLGMILFVLGLCALGIAALWQRGQTAPAILLGCAMVVPFALAIVVSYLVTPIFMPRVLVWMQIPAFVLLAASLQWWPSMFLQRSAAAITAVFLTLVWITAWGRPLKEPWREVARVLIAEAGPDDVIVLDTPYAQVPMLYYRVNERTAAQWLPLPDAYPLPLGPRGYPNGFFLRDEIDDETLGRVREAAAFSHKVWHVARGRTSYDWREQLARTFRSVHLQVQPRVYSGQTVLLTEYSSPLAEEEDPLTRASPGLSPTER